MPCSPNHPVAYHHFYPLLAMLCLCLCSVICLRLVLHKPPLSSYPIVVPYMLCCRSHVRSCAKFSLRMQMIYRKSVIQYPPRATALADTRI
ncbi:hypothetical protein C2E23DRAFT_116156 [Lenzites betulinus]|nr:hypothetical protein C2E23DRAFT_116156 [Lenzites betulinus]